MSITWEEVQPKKDWVLVKADPRVKKTAGGIYLTEELTQVERVMEGTGTILKAGYEAMKDVEVGERICFRGFLKDMSFEMFDGLDDCPVFLLKIDDVLMVIPDDINMGAFSGAPRVPDQQG